MLLKVYGGSNSASKCHRVDYLEFIEILVDDEYENFILRRDIVFDTLTLRICPYYYTDLVDPKTKNVTNKNFLVSQPAIVWGTIRYNATTEDFIPLESLNEPLFNFGETENLSIAHTQMKIDLMKILVIQMKKEFNTIKMF